MLRVFVVGAVALSLLLAGCLGDAVSLDVVDWHGKSRHEVGNATYPCDHGGNLVTLKVANKGEVNLVLDLARWQAVWNDVSDVRMSYTEGAQNAPPDSSVEKRIFFCNPTSGSGQPDAILLYDRPVYGSDKEEGAVVVARVQIG